MINELQCMDVSINTLEHHGVPGMKWGVRKSRPSKGNRQKRSRKTISPDSVVKRPKTKRGMSQLSNAELQKSIARMQLETNYKRLNTTKTGVSKLVTDVMKELTKESIKAGVKTTAKWLVTPEEEDIDVITEQIPITKKKNRGKKNKKNKKNKKKK